MLCLTVDVDTVNVVSAFELIPSAGVKDEVLGEKEAEQGNYMSSSYPTYNIVGPWKRFVELPMNASENGLFRILCEGRSSRGGSTSSRLLMIEYNETTLRCEELRWPAHANDVTDLALVGASVFLTPSLVEGALPDDIAAPNFDGNLFVDRSSLSLLYSNGSANFWAEGGSAKGCASTLSLKVCPTSHRLALTAPRRSRILSCANYTTPAPAKRKNDAFDIQCFELMTKTPPAGVMYSSSVPDETCEQLRKKLASWNCSSEYTVLGKEGGTLGFGLGKDNQSDDPDMICAVRVLVGTTSPESVPRKLAILGRDIPLKGSSTKRWYDMPMLPDEIVCAYRMGFATVAVGNAVGGNPSVIDAVEVYTQKKSSLFKYGFEPVALGSLTETGQEKAKEREKEKEKKAEERSSEVADPTAMFQGGVDLLSGLVAATKCFLDVGNLSQGGVWKGKGQQVADTLLGKDSGEGGCLFTLLSCTALDDPRKPGLRQSVLRVISQIQPTGDDFKADYVGRATLAGVLICVQDVCKGLRKIRGGRGDSVSRKKKDKKAELLQRFAICLNVAEDICSDCPEHWVKFNATGGWKEKARELSDVMAPYSAFSKYEKFLDEAEKCGNGLLGVMIVATNFVASCELDDRLMSAATRFMVANCLAFKGKEGNSLFVAAVDNLSFDVVNSLSFNMKLAKIFEKKSEEEEEVVVEVEVEEKKETKAVQLETQGSSKAAQAKIPRPLTFKCDGCECYPIENVRYTIDDGVADFDLCAPCYQEGLGSVMDQPEEDDMDDSMVLIRGAEIMSLAELRSMKPQPVASGTLASVEALVASLSPPPAVMEESDAEMDAELDLTADMSGDEGDDDLALALALSMGQVDDSPPEAPVKRKADTEGGGENKKPTGGPSNDSLESFAEHLFGNMLTKLADLDEISEGQLTLLIALSRANPDRDALKLAKFALELFFKISKHGKRAIESAGMAKIMGCCLETLLHLLRDFKQPKLVDVPALPSNDRSSYPRFVCEAHNVPALRRRVSAGENKDRRFYICGVANKAQRCSFHRWADEGGKPPPTEKVPSATRLALRKDVLDHCASVFKGADFQGSLLDFIEVLIKVHWEREELAMQKKQADAKAAATAGSSRKSPSGIKAPRLSDSLMSATDLEEKKRQQENGVGRWNGAAVWRGDFVFAVKRKEGVRLLEKSKKSKQKKGALLLEGPHDLLGEVLTVADEVVFGTGGGNPNSGWQSRWKDISCTVIASSMSMSTAPNREVAKRLLRGLCGSKREYARVKADFLFMSQLRVILESTRSLFLEAQAILKKGHSCADTDEGVDLSMNALLGRPHEFANVRFLIRDSAWRFQERAEVNKAIDSISGALSKDNKNWGEFMATDAGVWCSPGVSVSFFLASLLAVHSDEDARRKLLRLLMGSGGGAGAKLWSPFVSDATLDAVLGIDPSALLLVNGREVPVRMIEKVVEKCPDAGVLAKLASGVKSDAVKSRMCGVAGRKLQVRGASEAKRGERSEGRRAKEGERSEVKRSEPVLLLDSCRCVHLPF